MKFEVFSVVKWTERDQIEAGRRFKVRKNGKNRWKMAEFGAESSAWVKIEADWLKWIKFSEESWWKGPPPTLGFFDSSYRPFRPSSTIKKTFVTHFTHRQKIKKKKKKRERNVEKRPSNRQPGGHFLLIRFLVVFAGKRFPLADGAVSLPNRPKYEEGQQKCRIKLKMHKKRWSINCTLSNRWPMLSRLTFYFFKIFYLVSFGCWICPVRFLC